jgi:hypothetical protein
MQSLQVIKLARKHIGKGDMESSARLSLSDANHLYDRGLLDYAKKRALDSLNTISFDMPVLFALGI